MRYVLIVLVLWGSLMSLQAQKIKVACVGNSVTYGYLLPNRDKNAYPFQLAMMLGDELKISGMANAGERVLVQLGKKKGKAVAAANGKWTAILNDVKAGGPYQLKVSAPSGELEFKKEIAWVEFEYAQGIKTTDGMPFVGFELAGQDGIFYPADAVWEGNRMKVFSPQVCRPCRVRYGWKPYFVGNLINREGLPASTFSSER